MHTKRDNSARDMGVTRYKISGDFGYAPDTVRYMRLLASE